MPLLPCIRVHTKLSISSLVEGTDVNLIKSKPIESTGSTSITGSVPYQYKYLASTVLAQVPYLVPLRYKYWYPVLQYNKQYLSTGATCNRILTPKF